MNLEICPFTDKIEIRYSNLNPVMVITIMDRIVIISVKECLNYTIIHLRFRYSFNFTSAIVNYSYLIKAFPDFKKYWNVLYGFNKVVRKIRGKYGKILINSLFTNITAKFIFYGL